MDGQTDVRDHRLHVRKGLTLMRDHTLYTSLKKYTSADIEIPLLTCIVGKHDPEKIKVITYWPVPIDVNELRVP